MIAKSWAKVPKYIHLESSLRKYALDAGFDIKINVDKGWLRETVFFEANGTEEQIEKFKSDWNNWLEYNM